MASRVYLTRLILAHSMIFINQIIHESNKCAFFFLTVWEKLSDVKKNTCLVTQNTPVVAQLNVLSNLQSLTRSRIIKAL